ncbi:MAG: class I SAM-dependent methyltransferase [Acidimicrobiia bacterium]
MRREPFARMDESDDATFYAFERKVVHLDPGAIEALRAFYARVLPRGGSFLDLMSSWRSHLPDGLGRVVGLGMNSAEMADNPQLSEFVVHDLNREPRLPFDDGSFDAVVCAVSVQYLTQPVEVFAEAARVLRPGGPVVVSFSNRCFPTKAVAIWRAGGNDAHRRLVSEYLERSGFTAVTEEAPPSADDPLFVVWGRRPERA